MADICVLYDSKNIDLVRKLVRLLKKNWDVWWAEDDIVEGDWDRQVRNKIKVSCAIVVVVSKHIESNDIVKDELLWAKKNGRLIFPIELEKANLPLGLNRLNRTIAHGWKGDSNNQGINNLLKKINAKIPAKPGNYAPTRSLELFIGHKKLKLPSFVFSLSSHETQLAPIDGLNLLQYFRPPAILISAYDAYKYYKKDKTFTEVINVIRESDCLLFLDSGNYEAFRKKDHYSQKNKKGWRKTPYREIASRIKPDIAFSYDKMKLDKLGNGTSKTIVKNYRADLKALDKIGFPICPIVHLPENIADITISMCASKIVSEVASQIDPFMIAIPERELGAGLLERVITVREIRRELNKLGRYYPLHLLGTGNPLTMIALAAAGADCFDGLEWCRTVADYDRGTLFHFQHLDCFYEKYLSRIKLPEIRNILENKNASYGAKVASYNFDFFSDWTKTMQDMISAGLDSVLLKNVPNIGDKIAEELAR